jgi:IMP dehydrogenase
MFFNFNDKTNEGLNSPDDVFNPPIALTFDDVLLRPQYSDIPSRSDVDISSSIAPTINLSLPVISANMNSVTESKTAIAMALGSAGKNSVAGLGFIHRFNSIKDQVKEVERVKRFRSYIIENPYQVGPNKTIKEAVDMMNLHQIGGLMVVDPKGALIGILTRRDVYGENPSNLVEEAMTKRDDMVVAKRTEMENQTTGAPKAREMMHQARVEKLPLIDDDDQPVGLIVMKDIRKLEEYPNASINSKGQLMVGAAVGVVGDHLERTEALRDAGVDMIVSDVAHAHHELAKSSILEIQKITELPITAGTVSGRESYRFLAELGEIQRRNGREGGVTAVAVGVGSGSICSTRLVSGHGMPQLQALYECRNEQVKSYPDVKIIADGGMRKPADIDKALVFADAVKLGSMLAGTPESPGEILRDPDTGQQMKMYRGMASQEAFEAKLQAEGVSDLTERSVDYNPEGVSASIPLKPPIRELLARLAGSIRSCLSYSGARDMKDFKEKATWVRITDSGVSESHTHIFDQYR